MKTLRYLGLSGCLVMIATLLLQGPLLAQEEKPFADQKFVLQISDMDPSKQTLVLNVAGNILKAYGQDQADVEIVAFGPGLRLLFQDNNNSGRIDGLVIRGVLLIASENTIKNMTKKYCEPVNYNSHSTTDKGSIDSIK